MVYKQYVLDQHRSISLIKSLEKKSSDWQQFCQYVKDSGVVGQLDLPSLLIQPVQVCLFVFI